MPGPSTRRERSTVTDAYDDVEVRVGWGGCSLLLLALIVAVAVTLPLLITRGVGREWVRLVFLLVPAGALAGVAAGAVGLRRRGRRGLALLGLVLNGAVIAAIAVAVTWAVVR
jgi:hypothetical protein